LGIALKRIEVIADDEDEIIEAARRMSSNYDFVVTSGGIGPTYVFPLHLRDFEGLLTVVIIMQARRHNLSKHCQSLQPPPHPPRRGVYPNEKALQTASFATEFQLGYTVASAYGEEAHD
jgi:hypothetical protein